MDQRKSSSKYWLLFFVWIGILVLLIVFLPQFMWTALPGIVTNFVLALDLM